MFADCAFTIVYYIFAFRWLDKETAKHRPYGEDDSSIFKSFETYELERDNKFGINLIKMLLMGLFLVAVSAVTCCCDGLSDVNYIAIPLLVPMVGGLILGFVFSCVLCNIGIKNKLVIFQSYMGQIQDYKYYNKYVTHFYGARGGSTLITGIFFGVFMMVPIAQTIYTIVLLCV